MAFGAMEDLNGSFELIFFPKTWSKFREELELDRVYMVRGEARIEAGDRAKVIVNSITNNLSVAQPVIEDREVAPVKSAPILAVAKNGRNVTHPPKPESGERFGDEMPSDSTPPPPPNFEEQEAEYLPPVIPKKQATKAVEQPGPIVTTGVPGRTIDIEIKADPNWPKVCRQIVRLVSDFEGQDGLRIHIAGQPLVMEFPNQRTRLGSELLANIEQIPAVIRVEVIEITGSGPNSPS